MRGGFAPYVPKHRRNAADVADSVQVPLQNQHSNQSGPKKITTGRRVEVDNDNDNDNDNDTACAAEGQPRKRKQFAPYVIPKHRDSAAADAAADSIDVPAVLFSKKSEPTQVAVKRQVEIDNGGACATEQPSRKRSRLNEKGKIENYIPIHRRKDAADSIDAPSVVFSTKSEPLQITINRRVEIDNGSAGVTEQPPRKRNKREKHHANASVPKPSAIRQLIDKVTAEDNRNAAATANATKGDDKIVVHEPSTSTARRMIFNSLGITVKKTSS
jgi:3-methyladenine DNA glycosylase Mpg